MFLKSRKYFSIRFEAFAVRDLKNSTVSSPGLYDIDHLEISCCNLSIVYYHLGELGKHCL